MLGAVLLEGHGVLGVKVALDRRDGEQDVPLTLFAPKKIHNICVILIYGQSYNIKIFF